MRSGAPTPERIPRQVLLKKPLRFIFFFVFTTDLVSCYLLVQLYLSLSYQPHVVYDSPQLLVTTPTPFVTTLTFLLLPLLRYEGEKWSLLHFC